MDSLQILWVNLSHTPYSSGVKTHTHPYYHLFAVKEGSLEFTVNSQSYTLNAGDCLIVPKNITHSYVNNENATVIGIELKFTLQPETAKSIFADDKTPAINDDPIIVPLLNRIVSEYSRLGPLADDAAHSYLGSVLTIMGYRYRLSKQRGLSSFAANSASALTTKAIAYLEEHYRETFSLDAMADALGFNKSYLCTAFKSDTKTTILDCLNRIRIHHAAALISYSEYSISTVAALCGFGSASTFNHVFQKYIGTTPMQIRKAYPRNILVEPLPGYGKKGFAPGSMLYNVLAGQTISLETIVGFKESEEA